MKNFVLAVAAVVFAVSSFGGDLPSRSMTPGALNPNVNQDNIQSTVCVKGWTKTVRPPVYFTNKLKKEQIQAYGYEDTNPRDYEEDHLIPLSVGGNPTDPQNLWPQPRKSEWSAEKKDQLEFAVYKAVCRGEVSLADARAAFAPNWIAGYKKYSYLLAKYKHGQGFAD